MHHQPLQFSPAIHEVLELIPRPALDAGEPSAEATELMDQLDVDDFFEDLPVQDSSMAEACVSGLWLKLNELERSHAISQDLKHPSGSFWQGIHHRRELDPMNAKYWFHQVGEHQAFAPLLSDARQLSEKSEAVAPFHEWEAWDADLFVDYCDESLGREDPLEALLLKIQEAEWLALFQYCFDAALGRPYSLEPEE